MWRANFPEVEVFPPDEEITDMIGFNPIPRYKEKSFLHQKYVVEGLSIAQIASHIFSSQEAVRANLIRFKIPLREPHKQHGRPSQPKYGQKVRNGKVITHLAERRVIEAVLDMRRNNLSLPQIAKFLTKFGVPTKQRGVAWHPQMVKRLLSTSERDIAKDMIINCSQKKPNLIYETPGLGDLNLSNP